MSRPRPTLLNVQTSWPTVTALSLAFLLWLGAGSAGATAFLPPNGEIFQGEAGQPVSSYTHAAGKHPAVYQEFLAWGQYVPAITQDALSARSRLMIMISTRFGSREAITPGQIAAGRGDGWLISLQKSVASSGLVTYVRLMAEMDGYWNAFCAYSQDGSPRDAAHSTTQFRRAWKRVTLIFRGGSVSRIDAELRRLGMPALRAGGLAALPRPQVAMLWVPQVAPGDPDVPGNQPSNYWPGRRWVDWVGTDFYSFAPNFSGLSTFYNEYSGLPFVFGEYAVGETSDDPGFINQLFGWVSSHPRVRMMIYNQGVNPSGPFRLSRFPQTAAVLRHLLGSRRFPAFAPEWQR